jgi:hypothetical protein
MSPEPQITKTAYMHTQGLRAFLLFLLAICGCITTCIIAHYILAQENVLNIAISLVPKTILGIGFFISFIFGHAIGAMRSDSFSMESYTLSLCLRVLSSMFGMTLAILTIDHVWSSAASLIAILSLIGTQYGKDSLREKK